MCVVSTTMLSEGLTSGHRSVRGGSLGGAKGLGNFSPYMHLSHLMVLSHKDDAAMSHLVKLCPPLNDGHPPTIGRWMASRVSWDSQHLTILLASTDKFLHNTERSVDLLVPPSWHRPAMML